MHDEFERGDFTVSQKSEHAIEQSVSFVVESPRLVISRVSENIVTGIGSFFSLLEARSLDPKEVNG